MMEMRYPATDAAFLPPNPLKGELAHSVKKNSYNLVVHQFEF